MSLPGADPVITGGWAGRDQDLTSGILHKVAAL